jgi:hypothetical protein
MESTSTDLKTKIMTDQEAFNDPEMKTILLLSGYARELGDGKDFEETTYKIAETLVKIFSKHHVSQQRELLVDYENFKLMTPDKFNCAEQAIDKYLATNCG